MKVEGEHAVELFGIVKANNLLPEKVEDLVPLSFIGQAAVEFFRSRLKAMDKLKLSEEQRKATLRDGQEIGEMLLDIEARIGQLLPSREEAKKIGGIRGGKARQGRTYRDTPESPLPEGITHKRASASRKISEHPEIVERIKKQARENEDIPTKTAVLNAITCEQQKESKKRIEELSGLMPIEQATYLINLEIFLVRVTKEWEKIKSPPKNWNSVAFERAQEFAVSINKKLSTIMEKMKEFLNAETKITNNTGRQT